MINLSIVIPCYNEGKLLTINLAKLIKFMNIRDIKYEIIAINDGSTDNSKELLNNYKDTLFLDNNLIELKFISYKQNRGKGYAIKKGIEKAEGEYILFMDADFSTDLNEIINFWENKKIANILIGSRVSNNTKNKNLVRKFISFCCHSLTSFIVPLNIKDTQCGFKFFKSEIAKKIVKHQYIDRFCFDIEYLYIAKLNNIKVKEIEVKWIDDKNSTVKIIKDSIKFFKDLIKIRKNKKEYIF